MPPRPYRGGVKVGTQQYKTQPCRYLAQTGFCKFGERCTFLHDSDLAFPSSSSQPQSTEDKGVWEDIEEEYDGAPSMTTGSSHPFDPSAQAGDAYEEGVLELDWKNMDSLQAVGLEDGLKVVGPAGEELADVRRKEKLPSLAYRTRPCRHYARGACQMGDRCNFLHAEPVDSAGGSLTIAFPSKKKGPYKVTPCHFFRMGNCVKADCTFSHGEEAGPASSPTTKASSPAQVTSAHTSHPLYKTQPCVYFKQGTCGKGEACTFRHDDRPVPMVDCTFFLKTGRCDFGENCRYRHPTPSANDDSASPRSYPKLKFPKQRAQKQSPVKETAESGTASTPAAAVEEEDDEQIEVVDSDEEGGEPAGGWEADVGQLVGEASGQDEDELDRLFTKLGV